MVLSFGIISLSFSRNLFSHVYFHGLFKIIIYAFLGYLALIVIATSDTTAKVLSYFELFLG